MRIIAMTIVLVGGSIVTAGPSIVPNIQNGSLLRWPRDFSGVAVIPSDVRHIRSEAFSGCKGLTAAVFPESLETIGSFAFSGCNHLQDIRIPASVTNIGRSAFFNCSTLTNVVILARVREIPGNMCSHCCGLRHVELSDGIVEIGDLAFWGCRSLQNVSIPSSVMRIGRGAFVGCGRLSCIEFPKGIELVDEFAFYGCFDLKRLVFHSVPLKLGGGAFKECYNLGSYIFSDAPRNNVLYSVSPDCEITTASICKKECFVGRYETVEEALLSGDNKLKLGRGMFEGLEQVLRIAADGMVDEMPDRCYPVGKMDALAANLFKLSEWDDAQAIKDYFRRYSSSSVDTGTKLVANLCVQCDIAITTEFDGGRLERVMLSDGLKEVIRRKLQRGNVTADEGVMKWLR